MTFLDGKVVVITGTETRNRRRVPVAGGRGRCRGVADRDGELGQAIVPLPGDSDVVLLSARSGQ